MIIIMIIRNDIKVSLSFYSMKDINKMNDIIQIELGFLANIQTLALMHGCQNKLLKDIC